MKKLLFCFILLLVFGSKVWGVPQEPRWDGVNIIGIDLTDNYATNHHRVNIKTDDGHLTTLDSLFEGKTSTTTAGKTSNSETISFNVEVKKCDILNKGAESSVTSNYWSGVLYIPGDISISLDFIVPPATYFYMTTSVGSGATIYYTLSGAK